LSFVFPVVPDVVSPEDEPPVEVESFVPVVPLEVSVPDESPDEESPSDEPPEDAPPVDAPPVDAPPVDAPPVDAPPEEPDEPPDEGELAELEELDVFPLEDRVDDKFETSNENELDESPDMLCEDT
jgi:hypothetical protein